MPTMRLSRLLTSTLSKWMLLVEILHGARVWVVVQEVLLDGSASSGLTDW